MYQDLSPVEFFLRKFNTDAWLQIGSYLFSRKLVELAGPWYGKPTTDDDADYIARVVARSDGILFVPGPSMYSRIGNIRSSGHNDTPVLMSPNYFRSANSSHTIWVKR